MLSIGIHANTWKAGRFGYAIGGLNAAYINQLIADCTTFSTRATAALTSANLSLARQSLASFSDYNV
jgi:hypothetical protein